MNGQGDLVNIICTQPRRVAATSVAERVAEEMTDRYVYCFVIANTATFLLCLYSSIHYLIFIPQNNFIDQKTISCFILFRFFLFCAKQIKIK